MAMIQGYPEGSDITILDAIYSGPKRNENGEWTNASMNIIFRDNKTRKKHRRVIEKPKIEFYMANDSTYIEDGVFPPYLKKEVLHPVICEYTKLKATIAELTGCAEQFYDNKRNGMSAANDMVHVNNRVYRSDMNIEDYYRYEFNKRYTNSVDVPLRKMYLDIEVDGINMVGDFPHPTDSPVNAVTIVEDDTNTVHTFLLRDKNNPQIEEMEQQIKNNSSEFFNTVDNTIVDYIGGFKKAYRLGLTNLKYNIYFFDEEIVMLYELFALINRIQPDFLLAWNMAFDIPFIIDRIRHLGYNPKDFLSHPDFADFAEFFYFVDQDHINEPAESGDFARIGSYTVYLDQMKQFASRRKGQHATSNKLDDIASAVAGIHKYDYRHITPDITKLPRVNFFIFYIYNVLDVLCQKAIEYKTGDIDFVFNKAISTNTRFSKVHRQLVYLYNKAAMSYENNGFIICNNINRKNKKPEEKFKGAYVADYRLNHDSTKNTLNGLPISLYSNADDFDYARLYPSTIEENNMATETQIGKLIIPEPLHDKDNMFGDLKFDRGGSFIEDFQPHMWLEFCERWLHLAGYKELIHDIREYYDTIGSLNAPLDYVWVNNKPLIKGLVKVNEKLALPLSEIKQLEKPLRRYKQPDFTKIKERYFEDKLKGE